MKKRLFVLAGAICMMASITGTAQDAAAKANEILKQARAAVGSESKFKSLQGLTLSGTMRQTFGERQTESELEIDILMPDKIKKTQVSQFATIVNALNGKEMWNDFIPSMSMGGGGGRGGFPGMRGGPGGLGGQNNPMADYMQMQQRRELVMIMLGVLLTPPAALEMSFSYVGEAPGPEGSKLHVIDGKSSDGTVTRLYIDQESKQLIGMSYKAKSLRRGFGGGRGPGQGGQQAGQQGNQQRPAGERPQAQQGGQQGQRPEMTPEERERRMQQAREAFQNAPDVDYRWAFSEYKKEGGFNLPGRITRIEGGTPNEEWELSKIKVNPKLTADKFEKK